MKTLFQMMKFKFHLFCDSFNMQNVTSIYEISFDWLEFHKTIFYIIVCSEVYSFTFM